MPIEFNCACGKTLKAPDGSAGRKARCTPCQAIVVVPDLTPAAAVATGTSSEYDLSEPALDRTPPPAPSAVHAQPISPPPAVKLEVTVTSRPSVMRQYLYLVLVLALLPLLLSAFRPKTDDTSVWEQTLQHTMLTHPEIADRITDVAKTIDNGEASPEDLLREFPEHRLDGALLARDSKAHWLIALAAAAGFYMSLLLLFPNAVKYAKGLLIAGITTGTLGVLSLICFQWAAHLTRGVWIRGGRLAIIFLIIKFIGFSYSAADDPDNGFLASFFGFTCGVGLCEEITKLLPLLFRIKPIPGEEDATWYSLLLWGLASGIGFGIAEGIMYSGRYYNGIEGPGIYMIRFISCVVLHATWAGAVGVTLYNRKSWLHDAENGWMYSMYLIGIVLVPMTLHGLYDTLLKKEMNGIAVIIAFISFAWLIFQIERMRRREPEALAIA